MLYVIIFDMHIMVALFDQLLPFFGKEQSPKMILSDLISNIIGVFLDNFKVN